MNESYTVSNLIEKLRLSQLKSLVDWQSESDFFIPLRASVAAFAKEDSALENDIESFLLSDKKVMLLLGDSGSGKSLYTQGLVAKKWQSYSPKKIIPLWISLPCLKNPIKRAIEETLQKAGCNDSEIETLRQENEFLFIFDGYDEIRQIKNLYVTNRLETWQAKIIITCRREYLYHADNYALYFTPFIKERALYTAYMERVIKPFSTDQIDLYLQQAVARGGTAWSDWRPYRSGIEEIPGLSELLSSPFMLKLAISVLPSLLERYQERDNNRIQMTQTAIYDAFIEQWFERQQVKLKLAKEIPEEEDKKPAFWGYAKALAQAMHEAKITVVNYELSGSMFDDEEANPWTSFFSSEDKQIALLQTACLVREISQKHYAFVHASLLSYFLSRHLYEEILIAGLAKNEASIIEASEQTADSEKSSDENSYFNRCLMVRDNETIQFSADKICEGEEGQAIKRRYFSLIESSKNNPAMSIAAANAITILNRARISFSGMDFQDIHIPDAELEGGIFHYTDFRCANLIRVNFTKAYLARAQLQEADMTDVKYGELPRLKFKNYVKSQAYSPDGQMLAIAIKYEIIIFDARDKSLFVQCKLQEEDKNVISSIVFTGNSSHIVSCHVDGKIRLWNTKTGNFVKELKDGAIKAHDQEITCVDYHSETDRLLSGSSDNTIKQWSGKSWRCLTVSKGHTGKITTIAFHPDGKRFVSGSEDTTLRLWSSATGKLIATSENHKRPISCVAFNSKDASLASCGSYNSHIHLGIVNQWIITNDSFNLLKELLREPEPYRLAYSPDGIHLLIGYDTSIEQLSAETGVLMYSYQGQFNRPPISLAYSIDGFEISLLSDHAIAVCQWAVVSTLGTDLAADRSPIRSTVFNPMRKEVASVGLDGKLRRWDGETGSIMGVSPCSKEMWKSSLSPDGKHLASCDLIGRIEMINLANGKRSLLIEERDNIMTSISNSGNEAESDKVVRSNEMLCGFISIAYSSDGQRLAVGGRRSAAGEEYLLAQFSSKTGELLVVSEGHSNVIASVQYSRHDQWLVSGSWDKTIRLWDASTGQPIRVIEGHRLGVADVAFSPDDQRIAGCSSETLREWDASTGKLLLTLKCRDNVTQVAYHPTKRWLFGACTAGSIYVWDVLEIKNPHRIALIPAFQKPYEMVINSQGDIILGGDGGAVNYWECDNRLEIPRWTLKWSTKPCQKLIMKDSHIEQTKGLKDRDQVLFSQLGVRGVSLQNQSHMDFNPLHDAIDEDDIELFEALLCQGFDAKTKNKVGDSLLRIAIVHGCLEMVKILLQRGEDVLAQQPDGDSLLACAAFRGHKDIISLLLDYGANIDFQDDLGTTPLHLAAVEGYRECVEILLESGANINIINKEGANLLHCVVQSGYIDCVEFLLPRCPEQINSKTEKGISPLHLAVDKRYINIIEILLSHGADIDAQNNEGFTPLHGAALGGLSEIAGLLLEHGANANMISTEGKTVLHYVADSGDSDCLELLLTRCSNQIDSVDKDGDTALGIAVCSYNGNINIVEMLLAHGAGIDIKNNAGVTPLHYVAYLGSRKIVELFLECGANIDIPSTDGRTLLGFVAGSGDSDCVEFLLTRCLSQINLVNSNGLTPLHYAVMKGDKNTVKTLLAHGANIDAQSNIGLTPLHLAASGCFLEIVEFLLKRGANIDLVSRAGETMLHFGAQSDDIHCLTFLLSRCTNQINSVDSEGWTPLHFAATNGCLVSAELLLAHQADIEAKTETGETPLLLATLNEKYEAVEMLLKHNASIKHSNNDDWTPLQYACDKGNRKIIDLLIAYGADIHERDKDGVTLLHVTANAGQLELAGALLVHGDLETPNSFGRRPLHGAARAGQENIVRLFLENKACVNIQDTEFGHTPLHYAAMNGHASIVKILIAHGADREMKSNDGLTALELATQAGHQSVVDLFKPPQSPRIFFRPANRPLASHQPLASHRKNKPADSMSISGDKITRNKDNNPPSDSDQKCLLM
jgi:ankyrin repeat protein/WD40 repeat protein